MARVPQQQAVGKFRNAAIEIERELALREDQFQFAHRPQRLRDLCRMRAQLLGQFAQNAMHFTHLFFRKANQFVIQIDRWITPFILRRCPEITGTTNRSFRMVTISSCRIPSSRCARRKRSSDS
jgi:hypothetical protein